MCLEANKYLKTTGLTNSSAITKLTKPVGLVQMYLIYSVVSYAAVYKMDFSIPLMIKLPE